MIDLSERATDVQHMVYFCLKKITMSDHFYPQLNL
jgi:hypothetical protein